jgi:hypothetical protein
MGEVCSSLAVDPKTVRKYTAPAVAAGLVDPRPDRQLGPPRPHGRPLLPTEQAPRRPEGGDEVTGPTCASAGCDNPVIRRPGRRGRPPIYCSPACRPSRAGGAGRHQISVEVDQQDADDGPGRTWVVTLRRGQRRVVVGRDLGRFSATALSGECAPSFTLVLHRKEAPSSRHQPHAGRGNSVTAGLGNYVTVDTEELRHELRGLSIFELVKKAAGLRPNGTDVVNANKLALRSLARRVRFIDAEMAEIDAVLRPLVAKTAPDLIALHGVGPDTAGALIVAAGDNPDRLRNEAAFAHLCGVSPLDASSGKQLRHRLNRGGDRQANAALWRIVLTRMSNDPRTQHYVERRTKEGLSKREAMRCLKRYVAREVFYYLVPLQAA